MDNSAHTNTDGRMVDDTLGPVRRWSAIARFLLGMMLILAVLVWIADASASTFFRDLADGAQYTEADAAEVDERVEASAQLYIAGFVLTAIGFIRWFFLAYRHTSRSAGHALNHRPGWAIGAWFVPFLNLVRPYTIMKELVIENSPDGASTALVSWWWGTLIASGLLARTGSVMAESAADLESVQAALGVTILSDVLVFVAAVLGFRLVGRVTRLIKARFEVPAPAVQVGG